MRINYLFIIVILLTLGACGLGGQDIDLPGKRPSGKIEGNILGGLYSGGTITAYTLDDPADREFLGSAMVGDDGEFVLDFTVRSQPILLEVRSGVYLDPSNLKIIDSDPGLTLSTALMFISGESHTVQLTPFTHLTVGLLLYLNEADPNILIEESISAARKKIDALYSISTGNSVLKISLAENANVLQIDGDERQGLLIGALAQLAYEERAKRTGELKSFYHLSTLNNIIYEDIRSDGVLDGKSVYELAGGIKTLAFGDKIIDSNFYRLTFAIAMQQSLPKMKFSDRKQQEDYILLVAQSESDLFDETDNEAVKKIVPEIFLVSPLAATSMSELEIKFGVQQSLRIRLVELNIDNIKYKYLPDSIVNLVTGNYSILLDTTSFNNGTHELGIIVTDTFNNRGVLTTSIIFDNEAPTLSISSANTTNVSDFLLRGTYRDEFSTVKSISIDGEEAKLLDGNLWEKPVTLSNGSNEFVINVEDALGNTAEFNTEVFYNLSGPVITVTSSSLTNISQFLLEGIYEDEDANIVSITVNDRAADMDLSGKKWSLLVSLDVGKNEFIIGVADDAAITPFPTYVTLDNLAPGITVTSDTITNTNQFLLQGAYTESDSGVNLISVNEVEVTITDDKNWSKLVSLNSGENKFVIRIEDNAGNVTEITREVVLYEQNPVVTVSSAAMSNTNEFTLTGEYSDGSLGLANFSVNGETLTTAKDNKWSKVVTLQSGLNTFILDVIDKVGNQTQLSTDVILDDLPPVISYTEPADVRFSNNDGSYTIGPLKLQNETALYIESNQLLLSGLAMTKENFIKVNIPYFSFDIADQPLDGLETKIENLLVEYRYLIDEEEILAWQVQEIVPESNQVLLPIIADTLSRNWFKTSVDAVHSLEIRVADAVGNLATVKTNFRAQFYYPDLTISLQKDSDAFSGGNFETRSQFVNKDVTAGIYQLQNSTGMPLKIHISDDSVHTVSQDYEQVQRENKVTIETQEVWRKNDIVNLSRKCPKISGSSNVDEWAKIKRLWDYDITSSEGKKWREKIPSFKSEPLAVFVDSPEIPLPTEWVNYPVNKSNVVPYTFNLANKNQSTSYNFGYILDYFGADDPTYEVFPTESKPGLITSWVKTELDDGKITVVDECPDIIAIRTRNEFSYLPIAGYPRNNVTLLKPQDNTEFSTNKIIVIDENGEEILDEDGWFNVPTARIVSIQKFVLTPDLLLNTDITVSNPNAINDYNLHTLDKRIVWNIGQNIIIKTQFNPVNLLDETQNIKQQKLEVGRKVIDFARN